MYFKNYFVCRALSLTLAWQILNFRSSSRVDREDLLERLLVEVHTRMFNPRAQIYHRASDIQGQEVRLMFCGDNRKNITSKMTITLKCLHMSQQNTENVLYSSYTGSKTCAISNTTSELYPALRRLLENNHLTTAL